MEYIVLQIFIASYLIRENFIANTKVAATLDAVFYKLITNM